MKTFLTQKRRLLCLGFACWSLFALSACHPDSAGVDMGYKLAKLGSNALSISSKLSTEPSGSVAAKTPGTPESSGQNIISVHN